MSEISIKTIRIDVSLKKLDFCIGQLDSERNIELSKPSSCLNNLSRYNILQKITRNDNLKD